MANIAIIFAGGVGRRMNHTSKPKQFLELYGKPVLVYTLEQFNNHPDIDGIVLVVLEKWIDYCHELIRKFGLLKVKAVIAGGDTAFSSQAKGLFKARELYPEDSVVLIHDGVRPLIDEATISDNISSVKQHGTAITVSPAIETITVKNKDGAVGQILDRSQCELARAPQSFYLKDVLEAHRNAEREGRQFIDSASMMDHYGHLLYTVEGSPDNIKITTPSDFYIFRALLDARENSQIFGI